MLRAGPARTSQPQSNRHRQLDTAIRFGGCCRWDVDPPPESHGGVRAIGQVWVRLCAASETGCTAAFRVPRVASRDTMR